MSEEQGYLIIFKHDTWRSEIGHYGFYGKEEFQSWTDRQNDELSSFNFLPSEVPRFIGGMNDG